MTKGKQRMRGKWRQAGGLNACLSVVSHHSPLINFTSPQHHTGVLTLQRNRQTILPQHHCLLNCVVRFLQNLSIKLIISTF